jgi:SAM-dependent methyltransferase
MLDSRRSNILIRPLTLVESINSDSKILAIGPRTEGEILLLHAYGFEFENIRGLDLFSYSPWIDAGDMHQMPYAESSFDAVMSSMVITYSIDQKLAAKEMLRVVRPSGIIAINLTYVKEDEDESDPIIRSAKADLRPQTVAQLLQLFDGYVDYIYFQQDAYPEYRLESANMIKGDPGNIVSVIFSVKKLSEAGSNTN